MSDFRYDDYMDDEEDQQELKRVKQNQDAFQRNYEALMKQAQPQPIKPETPKVQEKQELIVRKESIKKQPSRISIPPQVKKEQLKKDDSKKPSLPPPSSNQNNKAKLIDQHLKLKGQLKQLASKMDEIVQKQREKRKKKLNANAQQQDQRVSELKSQLKEQQIQINRNKAAIEKLRKNLEYKYDMHKIVQKQNELKLLKSQVAELEKEKKYLQKINKQEKSSKDGEQRQLRQRYDRMKSEISDLTQKNKKHIESINEKEKQIRKLHQNYITKQSKIKQIQVKLNSKKQSQQDNDLEYVISQLEDSIADLTNKKKDVQVQGQEKLKQLQRQKKRLLNQAERRKAYLDEKQKELKINKIQYQDIVRLINSVNNAKPKKQQNDDVVSKNSQKRKVQKGGRQRPHIPKNQQVLVQEPTSQKQTQLQELQKKQKHSIGVGGDGENDKLAMDDYTNSQFEEEISN